MVSNYTPLGMLWGKKDRDDQSEILENYPKNTKSLKFAHPKLKYTPWSKTNSKNTNKVDLKEVQI